MFSAALIRAFGASPTNRGNVESEPRAEEIQWRVVTSNALPNNSLHLTGISLVLIDNLPHDAVDFRQVNSGVRRLCLQTEVTLNGRQERKHHQR
jgi:hypothetical protein